MNPWGFILAKLLVDVIVYNDLDQFINFKFCN